jgi:hypothetical protein
MKSHDNCCFSGQTILVYESGMHSSEHRAIMSAFVKLTGVEVVTISHSILNLGLNSKKLCENKTCEEDVNSITSKCNDEYPEIFSNKYMQFQFERVEQEINSAKNYGEVFATYLDILKPCLVIFGHEAFTIERVLVRMVQDRKITAAGLLHGGLGFKFSFRGLIGEADTILVWNDIDIEWLVSFGADRAKLYKIGSIRYESLFLKYLNDQTVRLPEEKRAAKKRLGICTDKPLIVVTTAEVNTGFAAPVADASSHIKNLIELLSLVESRPDLEFIIKAHPSFDYYELYKRMLGTGRPNLKFSEHAVLSEVLAASDICLIINYCTTAVLEALLQKIPVIYLNNAVYPLSDWRDNLSEFGICRVKSMTDLEISIDRLLKNFDHRQYQLVEADKQIIEILGWEERSPSDRFIDFIKLKLYESKKYKEEDSCSNNKISSRSVTKLIECINKNNSNELEFNKIYTLAFLAGVKGLGFNFLSQIYVNQGVEMRLEQSNEGKAVRKRLVLSYIKGSLARGGFNHLTLNSLSILTIFITHPAILFQISSEERLDLLKFILSSISGRYYPDIIRLLNSASRRRYGIFG